MVTDYKCTCCGLDLADDGRAFMWDGESSQTKDFLVLRSTYRQLMDAEISGDVSETYCSGCGKFLRIYSIRKVAEGIEKPCKTVEKGIENYIAEYAAELQRLKDIKKRARFTVEREEDHYVVEFSELKRCRHSSYLFPRMTREEVIGDALDMFHEQIDESIETYEERYSRYANSISLIEDMSGRPRERRDPLEKVNCPDCGREIYRHVNNEVPCPKCGGELLAVNFRCYD